MKQVKIKIDQNNKKGTIHPAMYSSFVEHIGRAVYGGIYEPTHPTADEDGFRGDVIEMAKELSVPFVRYPGGNFVSGYNWKNGIGDKAKRPTLPDLAWQQLDPNLIGVDEFMRWLDKIGAKPVMAVNMGTGTPQEAFELLQYCNGTAGYWAELRAKNGHPEPYDIEYWCIGNEMDGEWQIGHLTAEEYAKKAQTTARMFKAYDPKVKLVFCGSSAFYMPTFPEWDREVISRCYNEMDFISCHTYYSYDKSKPEKMTEFTGSYADLDKGLTVLEGVIAEVKAKLNSPKDVKISMDEWNIWYQGEGSDWANRWVVGPAREETIFSAIDAVVFASMMSVLLNHADSIKMACFAQLVNVIAPIFTVNGGGAVKQTTFYPFLEISKAMTGEVYSVITDCDKFDAGKNGICEELCCAFSRDGDSAALLVCNLTGEDVRISVDCHEGFKTKEHISMSGEPAAKNTIDNPYAVLPEKKATYGKKELVLSKYSWNVIKLVQE